MRVEVNRDKIEELRYDVGKFEYLSDLKKECEPYGIDPYDDILHPTEYNTCDRCERIGSSEAGFIWLDDFEWDEDNPDDIAIQEALCYEIDYTAICYPCVKELKERGYGYLKGKDPDE